MIDNIMMSTSRQLGQWSAFQTTRLALTVEDGPNDGTSHLHQEGDARRQLDVLAELQVLKERDTLDHRVLAVEGAVHVRDRLAGENVGCGGVSTPSMLGNCGNCTRNTHQ